MSWSERVRKAGVAAGLAAIVALAGCTVRPLYGDPVQTGATGGGAPPLASISINAPDTRFEQEVYNHLIFLLNGGRGQPADPRYRLELGVSAQTVSTAVRQVADESQPTAGAVTLTSSYGLVDAANGAVVASGLRQITAAYDRPRQEFAALRAERDAQDRAARELAELVRLAVAQDLNRIGAR